MELQDAIIIGLAVAALALAILAIVFGIIFFIAQMKQAQKITEDNSGFTQQMNILLNDIRASQNVTRQQVKDQYDKLLDAAIHGSGGSMDAAATSAVQFGEFSQRLDSLEKTITGIKEPGKVEEQIRELRRVEETLNATVRQLAQRVVKEEKVEPKTSASRFEKFNEESRIALTVAQEESRRLKHYYIGTEHLLLGTLHEEKWASVKILTNLGIDFNKVRSAVEFIIGKGEKIDKVDFGLTPRAKKVIELAIDEAIKLNHNYIGTEHLLLGLLSEGEGVAASILDSFGLTLEKVRAEVKKISKK